MQINDIEFLMFLDTSFNKYLKLSVSNTYQSLF